MITHKMNYWKVLCSSQSQITHPKPTHIACQESSLVNRCNFMLPVAWVAFWGSLYSYIELCKEFFKWLGLFLDPTLLITHSGHCHVPPILSWSVRALHFGQ